MKQKHVAFPPPLALQAKLGSIIVHAEDFMSPGGHPFDREALIALLADHDVKQWLWELREMALLPVKR